MLLCFVIHSAIIQRWSRLCTKMARLLHNIYLRG